MIPPFWDKHTVTIVTLLVLAALALIAFGGILQ